MSSDFIVIAAAQRTPIGAFQGALSGAKATQLGAAAIGAAVTNTGIDPAEIDEVLMGCVFARGPGASAGTAGLAGCGNSCRHIGHYDQQDVRLRYENNHDGT